MPAQDVAQTAAVPVKIPIRPRLVTIPAQPATLVMISLATMSKLVIDLAHLDLPVATSLAMTLRSVTMPVRDDLLAPASLMG